MRTRTSPISENFIANLAEHLPGIFICVKADETMSLSHISGSCEKLSGYKPQELLRDGLLFIIDQEDLPNLKQKKQLAIEQGVGYTCEYRIMTKDSRVRWINEVSQPVFNEFGKFDHFEGYLRELHEKYEFSTFAKTYFALQDAVNKSSVVTICNRKGEITFANELFCESMEYSARELVGRDHRIVNSNVHASSYFKDLWDTVLSGQIWRGEMCNRSRSGKLLWFDTVITPLFDKQNNVVQFLAIRNNITEKKSLEKNYRELVENSKEFIFRVDSNSKFTFFNNYLQKTLKLTAEELRSYSLFDIIHPEHHRASMMHFKEVLTNRKQSSADLVFMTKGKKKIYVEGHSAPVIDNGKAIGVQSFFRDVTARKMMEFDLVKSQQSYKNVVSNINDAIVVRNLRGQIVFANQRFFEMFGNGHQDLTRLNSEDHIAPGWQGEVRKLFADLIRNETGQKTHEYQGIRSNGSLLWLEDTITLLSEAEQIIGTQSVIRDITEVKKKENELKMLINELTNRNNEMMQFNYIVSHNLRAPIANIIGLCNIIGGTITDAEKQNILEHIRTSSVKIDEIVKDLSLVLNTRTNLNAKKEKVNFKRIMRSIVETLEDQIIRSKCKLDMQISADANEVFSIKSYMESILYNLISNAIKYRSPERDLNVILKIHRTSEALHISVSDNGVGINLTENGAYMFGLYKRFHYEVEGKGLGLHMTKTQVESLNGKISVISEENVGSTFLIEIPNSQLKEYV
jgi:PAS domain S-box-containing protein